MTKTKIIDILKKGIEDDVGEFGRNQYLINRIQQEKPIFESDRKYLEKTFGVQDLLFEERENKTKHETIFLNTNLVACTTCKKKFHWIKNRFVFRTNGITYIVSI